MRNSIKFDHLNHSLFHSLFAYWFNRWDYQKFTYLDLCWAKHKDKRALDWCWAKHKNIWSNMKQIKLLNLAILLLLAITTNKTHFYFSLYLSMLIEYLAHYHFACLFLWNFIHFAFFFGISTLFSRKYIFPFTTFHCLCINFGLCLLEMFPFVITNSSIPMISSILVAVFPFLKYSSFHFIWTAKTYFIPEYWLLVVYAIIYTHRAYILRPISATQILTT